VQRRAKGGKTYQQAADELGYANRGTVYRIVQQALQQDGQETLADLRRLLAGRLEALLHSVWGAASWAVAYAHSSHTPVRGRAVLWMGQSWIGCGGAAARRRAAS